MRRKKIKKSLKNRLFVLSLSFVLVGGVCLRPFLYDVKAGEIAGTVGMLADTVTLWDIFNTVSAGAGVIVANDLLQSASQENLDDILGKPIGYINSQGLIEYNDGTSPPEWDWSGLEQALQNSSSARTKIIKGVFGQNGGTGQGGNDNDPWYRKFLNWAKAAVAQGKIYGSQVLGNITPLTLEAISLMMGASFGTNVSRGTEVTEATEGNNIANATTYLFYYTVNKDTNAFASRGWFRHYIPDHGMLFTNFITGTSGVSPSYGIANNSSEPIQIVTERLTKVDGQYRVDNTYAWEVPAKSYTGIYSSTSQYVTVAGTSQPVVKGLYKYTNDPSVEGQRWANNSTGTGRPNSPDVMTQIGPANGSSWVPTPYMDGEGTPEFQIIPQEVISNYTTYINNNNLTNEEIGEAFEEAVNPYVQSEPVPNPNPTTAPEPVATPTTAPAYDPEAELGTAANPITVAEPDPVPGIGAGEGQLPGIATLFPFCIPWDLKYIIDMFTTDQSALAPRFEWDFTSTIFGDFGTIVIDLEDFDDAAAIARKLEFLLFAVSLLIGTKNLIWS